MIEADARPAQPQWLAPTERRPVRFNAAILARLTALLALFALTHAYRGLQGDASLYIGRALADLDPVGIGSDLMFVLDGQSAFSLFRLLYARLVAVMGANLASLLTSALGLTLWLGGAALLAARMTRGKLFWASLITLAVMPFTYGSLFAIHYGEPLAIPRPFAEAFVLAAGAAMLAGRFALALAALCVGALLHPIMAAPGFALWWLLLCHRDRRWLWLAPAILCMAIAAAALRLPLADRLVTLIDRDWLDVLAQRNFYLFPSLWRGEAYSVLAVHCAMLIMAGVISVGRQRALMFSALGVGVGGIAIAALLGEQFPLLLVVQAQTWRASWFAAALAALAVAPVAAAMWRRGAAGQAVIILMALGWSQFDPMASGAAALIALAVFFSDRRRPLALSQTILNACWLAFVLIMVKWLIEGAFALHQAIALLPAEFAFPYATIVKLNLHSLPIAAIAIYWVVRDGFRAPPALVHGATALIALAAVVLWNRPEAPAERPETQVAPKEWMAPLAAAPGPVYWMGRLYRETWFWLGRANWLSEAQGSGIVFSRPLAMAWRARVLAAIDADMARDNMLSFPVSPSSNKPRLTRDGLEKICARDDRPAWVIAPVTAVAPVPEDVPATLWTPPFLSFDEVEPARYVRIEAFALARCGAAAGGSSRP